METVQIIFMAALTIVRTDHAVLLLVFRSFFLLYCLFLPPNLRGCLADHRQTLPRVRWRPRFIKFSHKFGWPLPPPKFGGPKTSKFWRDFGQPRYLIMIANIFGTQEDIVNRKNGLQTTDTPVQANLIWCTLVHKR